MAVTNCGGSGPAGSAVHGFEHYRPRLGSDHPSSISSGHFRGIGRLSGRQELDRERRSGNIDAHAVGGNDKLRPGETVMITWQFDASDTT